MATRFWVGGTGNWDASTTTHWAATTGGAGGASVPTSSDDVTFDASSGASATVTITAAANANTITINKSDLTLTHSAGSTVVAAVTLTTGTLNTNGQTCSWGSLSSTNSNTRTLTLGASSITITGTTSPTPVWDFTIVTNATISASSSTITCTGSNTKFTGGNSKIYGSIVMNGAGTAVIGTTISCTNFTRVGTAVKTDAMQLGLLTVSGVLTLTGNSIINRLYVPSTSGIIGTPSTTTVNGSVAITNCDFRDITAAGTAGTWAGTSLGNAGNNTNITFDTPTTRYWVATAGGNWSASSSWASSTNGTPGASVPLCHDAVIFDANSITSTGKTITADMSRLGKNIDFSAVTNSPALSLSTGVLTYGNLTMGSGMTTVSTSSVLQMQGQQANTLTSNGVTFNLPLTLWPGASNSVTLQDNLTLSSSRKLTWFGGTFNANNHNVSVGQFSTNTTSSPVPTRVITMGSGTWTLTGTGVVWDTTVTTNQTVTANTSTITISDTSSIAKTFAGGGATLNNLAITGGGTGAVIFSGANTFNAFTINKPKTVTFPNSVTQTFTNFAALGSSGSVITINSDLPGTAATLSQPSGTVSSDWLALTDSAATGGAGWYAGVNSTGASGANNSGWIFTAPPTSGFFDFM